MLNDKITDQQAKDTGLAIILICLLLIYFSKHDFLLVPAILVLILTMAWPTLMKPLACIWFWFSRLLGGVMSMVLFSIIFFVIASPIGFFRRLGGADAMQLCLWKKGKDSVFKKREHTFTKADLEKPY